MEYVFRGFYQRSSSGSRSSNYTYVSHQANQSDFESYNGGHFLGNRDVMMERQLEKEMIRRDILAEKAAMRRELEAEVWRELREEREMELRQGGGGDYLGASQRFFYDFPRLEEGTRSYDKEELPFQRAPQTIISEVKPPLDVEKKQVISLVRRYDFPHLKEGKIGGCEEGLLVKSPSDVFTEGKQIIFVAKPDANHPGKKRKNMSSPIEGPSEVTKKLTKEWTCALCQVSATSELGLEDHLKGKKHKSKQAGQKAGMIGLCSKKINNAPNPSQVVERVELEKSEQISKNHEMGVQNNEIAIVMERGRGGADLKMPNKKKMKFKFYCKICQVGAFSADVMANHEKGKKHLRLQLGARR
ncbi:Zinc finger, U1-type [Heracleum sosnowskyi]|uniref:Zinc finger, U1-type n=1 Tax=Heracleum sosnowskyi TaxID=360622 RepID=A0AAD8J4Z5_9APIA|nr:Zinc finger, U1-type [Heracleum sosnowskyi]